MLLNFGFAGCCINNFLQINLLLEKDHNVDNLLFKPHHKMSNKVVMPSEVPMKNWKYSSHRSTGERKKGNQEKRKAGDMVVENTWTSAEGPSPDSKFWILGYFRKF